MRIGLFLDAILTHTHKPGIQGDEIWARALCTGLCKLDADARVYGRNMGYMPEVDVAVYFYIPYGERLLGKKNILIFQNFTTNKDLMDARVKHFLDCKADVRATISTKLANDNKWEMMWPAVDMDLWQQQPKNDKYKSTLLYIGNNIKDQNKTKDFLIDTQAKVFGNGYNGPISHRDSLNWYSNAFACLNFGFDTSMGIVTARIFQLAAMKCFVMTEPTDDYKRIFGNSIIYVNSGKEVAEQLAYYQAHPKEREEKIEKAYEIVKENYNCKTRAEIDLLKAIKGML